MGKHFLFFLLFCSLNVFSQSSESYQTPNYAPKSPEAAAFLKYGNYPVNLSTGVPNISIPIYTIDVNGFSLPITLDYHASGVKVEQEASWVGLGWNLNFGAQVILNVKDDVDENNSETNNLPNLNSILTYYNSHPYDMMGGPILNEKLDLSRVKDSYSFSSPTASGEFFINYDTTGNITHFEILPPDAFKIETISGITSPTGGRGFKITDPAGNVYLFGTSEKSKMLNYGQTFNQGDYLSAWYVDEIRTPNNEVINFTYDDDGITEERVISQKADIVKSVTNCNCSSMYYTESEVIHPITTMANTTYTHIKRIKDITFNGGKSKISFSRTDGREDVKNGYNNYTTKNYSTSKLSYINIEQQDNQQEFQFVRGYQFLYSYFNPTATGSNIHLTKRLKLDKLVDLIDDYDVYEFKYFSDDLPDKDSYSKDLYGYYNGVTNYNLILPHDITEPYAVTIGSANRNVTSGYIKKGILTEIHYPSKGWTKFNYENNDYYGGEVLNGNTVYIQDYVDGVSDGDFPEPGESAGDQFDTMCPDDCIQYSTESFVVNATTTGSLSLNITHTPPYESQHLGQHQYGRVRLFDATGLVYDSDEKKDFSHIQNVELHQGPGLLVVEAWGGFVHVDADLTYNNGSFSVPSNPFGAGLRVANIENYDHDNTLLTKKEYSYTMPDNPAKSSGRRVNDLSMNFVSPLVKNFEVGVCPQEVGNAIITKLDYQFSYSIMSNSRTGIEGNTVTYQYVKEKDVNVFDESRNGYTLYKFTFEGDAILPANLMISTPWKRGKVLEKSEFKQVGGTDFILRKEVNKYIEDNRKRTNYKAFKMHRQSTINVSQGEDPNMPHVALSICGAPMDIFSAVIFHEIDLKLAWYYQKSTEVTDYFYDAANIPTGSLVTKKTYQYDNPAHMQVSSETVVSSTGENLKINYYYPQDPECTNEPCKDDLIAKYMIGAPLKTTSFRNSLKLSEQITKYKNWGNGILLPEIVQMLKGNEITPDSRFQYNMVDNVNGNVLELQQVEGIKISYIWGYYDMFPVVKLENAGYNEIPQGYINAIKNASNTGTQQDLLDAIDILRYNMPDVMVSGYAYEPLKGVTAITDQRGNKITYEYDPKGRLLFVKDNQGNILSDNEYHLKN